jgi:heme/copper-type cytochrome/quinol oxidase subunit 3
MYCPICKNVIGPWRTFLLGSGSLKCRKCGATLARENESKKLMVGALLTAMLTIRFLATKIPYWQALVIVLICLGLAEWWLVKLKVKKMPESKVDG